MTMPAAPDTVVIDLTVSPQAAGQTAELIAEGALYTTITTVEESRGASALLAKIQRFRRFVAAIYKDARKPLAEASRKLSDQEAHLLGNVLALEKSLTKGINAFTAAKEQERQAIERALREQEETDARAEQDAREASLRDAAARAPSKAVAKALTQQADAVAAAPVLIQPIEPEPIERTLAPEVHARVTYKPELTDLRALILQVAAGLISDDLAKLPPPGGPPAQIKQQTEFRAQLRDYLRRYKASPQANVGLLTANMVELRRLTTALRQDLRLEGVAVVKDTGLVGR